MVNICIMLKNHVLKNSCTYYNIHHLCVSYRVPVRVQSRGGSRNSLRGGGVLGQNSSKRGGGVRVQVHGNFHILTSKKKNNL